MKAESSADPALLQLSGRESWEDMYGDEASQDTLESGAGVGISEGLLIRLTRRLDSIVVKFRDSSFLFCG